MSSSSLAKNQNDTTGRAPVDWPAGVSVHGIAISLVIIGSLIWSYWPTIQGLLADWKSDQNYSVGQLVPLAALYLLWTTRARLHGCIMRTCWWGAGLILAAQLARFYGLVYLYESAERYSIVLSLAGVVLLAAGPQMFLRVKWVLLFMFFMVPLPGKIHNLVSGPLQDQASAGAVFLLELFGTAVAREGNVLILNETVPVAVAEACSGLRMLTAFLVVGSVLAYVVNRPLWQKVVLVVSTVPVAILCNLIRLFITARLFLSVGSETAEKFFHDFAGWTMMPMAIGFLVFTLWVMSCLVIPDDTGVGRRSSGGTSVCGSP